MLINSSFAYSSTNAPLLRRSGNAFKAGIQVLLAALNKIKSNTWIPDKSTQG